MQSHIIGSILSRLVGIVAVIVLLTATADPVPATIKEPALNAELLTAAPEDEIRVIVEFTPRVDLPTLRNMPRPQRRELMATEMKAAAERDQRGVRSLLQSRGVKGTRHLWMINSLAVKAPAKVIQELAAHPEVLSLRIDRKITAAEILLQSFPPPEANINTINANDLWVQGDFGTGRGRRRHGHRCGRQPPRPGRHLARRHQQLVRPLRCAYDTCRQRRPWNRRPGDHGRRRGRRNDHRNRTGSEMDRGQDVRRYGQHLRQRHPPGVPVVPRP